MGDKLGKKRGFLQPLFPCPASEVRRGIKAYQCSCRTETRDLEFKSTCRYEGLKHINVLVELKLCKAASIAILAVD